MDPQKTLLSLLTLLLLTIVSTSGHRRGPLKADIVAAGNLRCDAETAEYRVDRMFTDPLTNVTGSVESMVVGPVGPAGSGNVECQAVGAQTGWAVVAPYTACGFHAVKSGEFVSLTTNAFLNVRTKGGGLIRVTVLLSCVAYSADTGTETDGGNIPVEPLSDITASFDITVTTRGTQEFWSSFGNTGETDVHSISIELDEPFRQNYTLAADRCWATATPNPQVGPFFPFISTVSCNELGPDFVVDRRDSPAKQVFDVASFQLSVNSPFLYFHCEVNVCRNNGELERCREGCKNPAKAGGKPFKSGGGVRRLTTGIRQTVTGNRQPKRVVDLEGKPHLLVQAASQNQPNSQFNGLNSQHRMTESTCLSMGSLVVLCLFRMMA
ncbi:hypothetical protein BV898_01138 [Hypsibius exemplaris]|uniref:ZP domain-containing protein n=1 Tax=Hypsibius exemplaris TaxID=2072580 RepID=A0A1W0XBQ2_HYPEX|nr:hypothetical protein BV898_01138 [Hypsibius exemplaris]